VLRVSPEVSDDVDQLWFLVVDKSPVCTISLL